MSIVRSFSKFSRANYRSLIFVQNCRVKNTVLSLEFFWCHLPGNTTNIIETPEINFSEPLKLENLFINRYSRSKYLTYFGAGPAPE